MALCLPQLRLNTQRLLVLLVLAGHMALMP
jgi:hypothetical protein